MKKKTIWSFALALALVVSAIGTATSAFAATPAPMEPVTKIATENEDAIWEQIEAVEEKSDAIFQRNAALWEKLDEVYNALPDDYDFTNFDEAALIRSTNALTEAEKETLLNDIKELNELDAQMEKLYGQLPECDNMPLYEKALEKADPKVLDEIDTLEQEYDRLCEKNADLWDKVDEAYFNLPDDYDFDNYDEATFIRSLSFLTDAEKDELIADYNRLVELDNQLCKLYDTIWGDTGCESGICPFAQHLALLSRRSPWDIPSIWQTMKRASGNCCTASSQATDIPCAPLKAVTHCWRHSVRSLRSW